jgi:beta-phosphoglucomutase
MMPAAIVFDFDGVIANSEPLHLRAFQETLRAVLGIDLSADEYYQRYLGYDDEGAVRAVLGDRGLSDGEAQVAAIVADKAKRLPALLSSPHVLMPGAEACVSRLASRLPLAIASGARRDEIQLVLDARGLAAPFDIIVASGETSRGKPFPDPYQRAMALLSERGRIPASTPASACIAIEDSHWGLASAKQAGMQCVGITSSYSRAELVSADRVIDSLDELTVELLSEMAAGT